MLLTVLAALFLSILTFAATVPHERRTQNTLHWGGQNPLQFTRNGTFQVSVFSDLHFGENAWDPWGPQQDLNSVRIMNDLLDFESQQLVVLNGDLITGENTYIFNSTDYIDQIVEPIVQRNLPWASTYGNHDSQFNLSREHMLARERRYKNARTTQMVFDTNAGVTNYYLPVYPSSGSQMPCLLLWFFDSRGGFYYQQQDSKGGNVGQPDWVDESVVSWFRTTDAQLRRRYRRTIPSLAFVHIPTNASRALQTEVGVDPNEEPGIDDDYPLAPQAQGYCPDGVSNGTCEYGGQDTPFMQAITTTPGLMALFSGHDHGDTWCYKWDQLVPSMTVKGNGINLCFGQHSGYGGYGTWTRGARQIMVTEKSLHNFEVDTWIRLEDGNIVGAVTLNSTYGNDSYPATPNTHSSCPTCNYSIITPMPGTAESKPPERAKSIAATRKAIWDKIQQWLEISKGHPY